MGNSPLVSIAIVTYNQKPFLEELIESVLAQSYKNVEIVVADDCSTDDTKAMLLGYEKSYPGKFVLIFSDKNLGITLNQMRAHFACTGKYIAWTGGDDLMFPEKLSKQVAFMEAHPDCHIVYHNLEVFQSETGKVLHLYNNSRNKARTGDIRKLIKHGCFNGACSNMIRRDKAPTYGFATDLLISSDWFYYLETLKNNGRIYYIDEVLGGYRRHEGNITSSSAATFEIRFMDIYNTIEKLKSYPENYSYEISYALSDLYKFARHTNYRKNLFLSIKHNPLNFKSWFLLGIYMLSFTKARY